MEGEADYSTRDAKMTITALLEKKGTVKKNKYPRKNHHGERKMILNY